jgi:hypothetical protein
MRRYTPGVGSSREPELGAVVDLVGKKQEAARGSERGRLSPTKSAKTGRSSRRTAGRENRSGKDPVARQDANDDRVDPARVHLVALKDQGGMPISRLRRGAFVGCEVYFSAGRRP